MGAHCVCNVFWLNVLLLLLLIILSKTWIIILFVDLFCVYCNVRSTKIKLCFSFSFLFHFLHKCNKCEKISSSNFFFGFGFVWLLWYYFSIKPCQVVFAEFLCFFFVRLKKIQFNMFLFDCLPTNKYHLLNIISCIFFLAGRVYVRSFIFHFRTISLRFHALFSIHLLHHFSWAHSKQNKKKNAFLMSCWRYK